MGADRGGGGCAGATAGPAVTRLRGQKGGRGGREDRTPPPVATTGLTGQQKRAGGELKVLWGLDCRRRQHRNDVGRKVPSQNSGEGASWRRPGSARDPWP